MTSTFRRFLPLAAVAVCSLAPVARAQEMAALDSTSAGLPDAPSAVEAPLRASVLTENNVGAPHPSVAPKYAVTIFPDETAQTLTGGDKFKLGLRDIVSLSSLGGMIFSSGYSQLENGQPNYGTDRGAYGERLGAAGLRAAEQDILAKSLLSGVFHDDPRYYVKGSGHNFAGRAIYSVTRVFITRTDSGGSALNAPLLLGYAGTAATTYGYYPPVNQNFKDIASGYGSSLGGAALGNLASEFLSPLLGKLHF